jgi:nicotinic acid mononucleotide adenylyltransferase
MFLLVLAVVLKSAVGSAGTNPSTTLYSRNRIERRLIKNSKGLKVPDCNTEQSKHSFFVETIVHWNQLPDKVLCADSVEAFKTALAK